MLEDLENTEYRFAVRSDQILGVERMLFFNTMVFYEGGDPEELGFIHITKALIGQLHALNNKDGELVMDHFGMSVFYMAAEVTARLIKLPPGEDFLNLGDNPHKNKREAIERTKEYLQQTSLEFLRSLTAQFGNEHNFKEMKNTLENDFFKTMGHPN